MYLWGKYLNHESYYGRINWTHPNPNAFKLFLHYGNQKLLSNYFIRKRTLSLQLSKDYQIKSSHKGAILCSSLENNDYRYFITGGVDATVCLYDLDSACAPSNGLNLQLKNIKLISRSSRNSNLDDQNVLNGHTYSISAISWYPIDNGAFITASFDESIKLWDTNEFSIVTSFHIGKKIFDMKVRYDGDLIAAAVEDKTIRICDVRSGGCSHELISHKDSVTTVAWSPQDPNHLVSGARDGTIKIWDIRKASTDALVFSLDWQQDHTCIRNRTAGMDWTKDAVCTAHAARVSSLTYTASGNFIVSAGNDGRVRVWDAVNGVLQPSHISTNANSHLSYAMDTASFSLSGDDLLFYPYNTSGDIAIVPLHESSGVPLRCLTGAHLQSVSSIVYRPTTQQLLSVGRDGMIHIWDPVHEPAPDEDMVVASPPSLTLSQKSQGVAVTSRHQNDNDRTADDEMEGRNGTGTSSAPGGLMSILASRNRNLGGTRGGREQQQTTRPFRPPILQTMMTSTNSTSCTSGSASSSTSHMTRSLSDDRQGQGKGQGLPPTSCAQVSMAAALEQQRVLLDQRSSSSYPTTTTTTTQSGGFLTGTIDTAGTTTHSDVTTSSSTSSPPSSFRIRTQNKRPSVRSMYSKPAKRGR